MGGAGQRHDVTPSGEWSGPRDRRRGRHRRSRDNPRGFHWVDERAHQGKGSIRREPGAPDGLVSQPGRGQEGAFAGCFRPGSSASGGHRGHGDRGRLAWSGTLWLWLVGF